MRGTSLRTATVAVSQAVNHGLAARARPSYSRLSRNSFSVRRISSSSLSYSATYAGSSSVQLDDPRITDPDPKLVSDNLAQSRKPPKALGSFGKISLPKLLHLLVPDAYEGDYLEAQTLDEALAGVLDSENLTSDAAGESMSREDLRLLFQKHIHDLHIDVREFLDLRNTMLATSWPDVRRHMMSVADGRWPAFILQRTIHMVTTPSEISDALALLTMSISSIQTANKPAEYYKVLRYCLSSLSKSIVQEHGAALHLMPRLTEAVLALVEAVPAQAASNAELIGSLTSACTWLPDERARRAVMQVLDRLESLQGANAVDDIRGKVIRQCIASIERSVTTTSNKSASSKQFVNIVMMDRLLQHDYGTDADLKRRALRGSIIVAGNAEDFHRTWRYFRAYEQYKQGHGLAITGFDLQLLSKALARSQQGRKDAWRIFLQAERLLHSETDSRGLLNRPVSRKDKERDLMGICLDLLGVMSRSGDVRVSKIFSMLGITANDRDDPNVKASSKMNDLSKAMLQSRRRVHAYSVAMQGMLLRKKSHCALAIWQAMLMRGVLPNAAALSLLLQNLFGLGEVKTAMQQLHLWCEQGVAKPAKTCDNLKEIEVPSLVRPALADLETFQPGALSAPTSSDATIYKVTPDTILATVVFNGLQACGAKGVDALWEAYQQTIHLFPDAPVLAMLLKASCRDEGESGIDARFGREVFRTLLFNKHPELAEYENPLRAQLEANGAAGWILSGESVGDRVEQWLASVFRSKHAGPSTMTVPTADLSALSFTSELFEHYLRLLLHLQHSTGSLTDARTSRRQLVDLLGWMKELNIQPSTTHVALTVLEIEEHLPPPVAARQMAVLDAWLIDWLGERGSPEQHVMQRHWRWKMKRNESTKRNGSRKSWFDKVSGGRKPEWEKCS